MAVVNVHGQPAPDQRELKLRSAWFFGRSCLTSPKFWLMGIAFLALYLACNKLTTWHQFDGLAITLWSPDNGLSLLLLTEGAAFAPFVFLAAVLTDVFIAGVHHSLYVTVAVELVLTVLLKFSPRWVRLADVVVLLTFVPAGTALTSLSYCGVLYLSGALPADQFYAAMCHFWIGDTVGMITIIPAATSVRPCRRPGRRQRSRRRTGDGGQLVRAIPNYEAARNGARFAAEPTDHTKARRAPLVGVVPEGTRFLVELQINGPDNYAV